MPRTFSWLSAMTFLCLALLGAPVSAQPSADRDRVESLPPDCLAAGTISDAATVLPQAGDILSALSGSPAGASLRTGMGSLTRNPDLAGVDLSAPVRFFCMNSKLFPHSWVYQFGVTDAEALKKSLAANSQAPQQGEVSLHLEGRQATWSLDAKAAESVMQWQKAGGRLPDFRAPGQFQARLDVQSLLSAFDADFAAEVLLMKGRVRQAFLRGGRTDAEIEREISTVQAQLDSAAAAFRQVRDVDFALEFAPAFIRVGLDARLADSAPLRALFRAHAAGDAGLLGLCPPDASLVIVNNLSFMKAVGRMFLDFVGLPSPEKPDLRAGSGHRAIAFFLSQQPGEPDAATRLEILDMRDGDQAAKMRQEWDHLAAPAPQAAIPDQAGDEPFILLPIKAGEPTSADMRLAEIAPNAKLLQPQAVAMFQRFLGNKAQAAQECRGDTCITAVGCSPAERLRQAEALMEAQNGSLLASPRFQKSVASLPEKPNLLVYVSPDALRRWLALAGRISSQPISADALGLAAGMTIDGDGARVILKFPTTGIPAAK